MVVRQARGLRSINSAPDSLSVADTIEAPAVFSVASFNNLSAQVQARPGLSVADFRALCAELTAGMTAGLQELQNVVGQGHTQIQQLVTQGHVQITTDIELFGERLRREIREEARQERQIARQEARQELRDELMRFFGELLPADVFAHLGRPDEAPRQVLPVEPQRTVDERRRDDLRDRRRSASPPPAPASCRRPDASADAPPEDVYWSGPLDQATTPGRTTCALGKIPPFGVVRREYGYAWQGYIALWTGPLPDHWDVSQPLSAWQQSAALGDQLTTFKRVRAIWERFCDSQPRLSRDGLAARLSRGSGNAVERVACEKRFLDKYPTVNGASTLRELKEILAIEL